MKNKYRLILAVISVLAITEHSALAAEPAITLVFNDPQGLCKAHNDKTQFAFNYKYLASGGVEYYSGPVYVASSPAAILAPTPPDDGVEHIYSDFEITDQGDCGNLELDYNNRGSCYLTNLIPAADQHSPYSYKITLTPEMTANHTYGNNMYNLSCAVEVHL